MKSKWILYTESPHYHNGRYIMILEEIKYVNDEWHWYHHGMKYNYSTKYRIIKDINKPPYGYILSIIFNDYNSATEYKEYIENKYYNKINKSILDSEKFVEDQRKKFENEFRFGSERVMRKLKLNKINGKR